MAAAPLPDPVWTEQARVCLACAYPLEGLAAPGTCPECGTGFTARQLVLCGVVRRSSITPLWRRLVWALVLVFGGVYAYLVVFLIAMAWPVAVGGGVLVGGALVWLLITGPRERAGTERIVVMPLGIARLPIRGAGADGRTGVEFKPWPPGCRVELRRVGALWRRLVIRAGAGGPVIDAGVRCPDAVADGVLDWVRSCTTPSA